LKILLDATPLLKDWSGVGYVTFCYARELKKISDISFFYSWFFSKELKERPLKHYEKAISFVKKYVPRPYYLTYGIKTTLFNLALAKEKPDVFIQPNYISFNSLFSIPTITFIHDLSHIRYKEFHPPERVKFFEKRLLKSIQQSRKIVVISNFTKKELIETGLCKPEKIEVIYNGVDSKFSPISKSSFYSTGEKFGIEYKNYFLFVGTFEPRKNLETLLKAYLNYLSTTSKPTPLILVGGEGWQEHYFKNLLQKALSTGKVKKLGYVNENDLVNLYGGAKAFIFPSFYEGFGLPPLEAMACGTPVIASNSSSIPEIVGDAGILISPKSEEELREALIRIDNNSFLREELSKKGLSRAKQFSWEKSALQLYHLAVNVAKS